MDPVNPSLPCVLSEYFQNFYLLLTPLLSALPQNASATSLESALTNSLNLKRDYVLHARGVYNVANMQSNESYHSRFWSHFKDAKWGRDTVIIPGALSLVTNVALYLRTHKLDSDATIINLYIYGALLFLYFVGQIYRSVLQVDKDAAIALAAVSIKHANLKQEIEDEKRNKQLPVRPDIEIVVREILIQVDHGLANCFLDVYLHNSSKAAVIIPEFKITLRISDKTYSSSKLLDPTEFQTVTYVEDYENIGPEGPRMSISTREELDDLRQGITHITPLSEGKPTTGWLRFFVSPVPPWPTDESILGYEIRHDEEGEPYEAEDIAYSPSDRSVSEFQVSIKDPYGAWHSTAFLPYKKNWLRGVVKKLPLIRIA